ncbi:MAG: hypothetical protein ACRCYX_14575, partial [Dermatophilaceae bacterium]
GGSATLLDLDPSTGPVFTTVHADDASSARLAYVTTETELDGDLAAFGLLPGSNGRLPRRDRSPSR